MERGGISARWWLYFPTTIFYYLLISKVILGHFLTGESQDVPDPPLSRRLATKQGSRPPRGPSKGPRNIKQSSRVECNQCNKTFAHASYLTAHKAIHLGELGKFSAIPVGNMTGKIPSLFITVHTVPPFKYCSRSLILNFVLNESRSPFHERTILLKFLGIILRFPYTMFI